MKLTKEVKEERRLARAAARKAEKERIRTEAEKNQPEVKKLVITIEWKKSRTYGMNPHATAQVYFHNREPIRQSGFTCSGCGYDKESTVIADIFNTFLKYKLYDKKIARRKQPYGMRVDRKYYDGGIGTDCFYAISKTIGGEFNSVAHGETFNVYEYIDK
jgi:hypothetical protein